MAFISNLIPNIELGTEKLITIVIFDGNPLTCVCRRLGREYLYRWQYIREKEGPYCFPQSFQYMNGAYGIDCGLVSRSLISFLNKLFKQSFLSYLRLNGCSCRFFPYS